MRVFTIACFFAAIVALGAAAVLETFVQSPLLQRLPSRVPAFSGNVAY